MLVQDIRQYSFIAKWVIAISLCSVSKKNIPFSYNTNTFCVQLPFPLLLPVTPLISPLSQIHCSLLSPLKRTGLPVISTEHNITEFSKPRHKPSYQSWMRQRIRSKRDLWANNRVRGSSPPNYSESQKNLKLMKHTMYAEDLVQTTQTLWLLFQLL